MKIAENKESVNLKPLTNYSLIRIIEIINQKNHTVIR